MKKNNGAVSVLLSAALVLAACEDKQSGATSNDLSKTDSASSKTSSDSFYHNPAKPSAQNSDDNDFLYTR